MELFPFLSPETDLLSALSWTQETSTLPSFFPLAVPSCWQALSREEPWWPPAVKRWLEEEVPVKENQKDWPERKRKTWTVWSHISQHHISWEEGKLNSASVAWWKTKSQKIRVENDPLNWPRKRSLVIFTIIMSLEGGWGGGPHPSLLLSAMNVPSWNF